MNSNELMKQCTAKSIALKRIFFGVKVIKILLRKWKMRFFALQNEQQRMKLASFAVKSGNLLGDSHYKNKTVMNPLYLYNGDRYTSKMVCLLCNSSNRSLCISMTCIVLFCCQCMTFLQAKWQWIIRDIYHSDQRGRLTSAIDILRLCVSALTFTSINWLKYQRSKSDTFV